MEGAGFQLTHWNPSYTELVYSCPPESVSVKIKKDFLVGIYELNHKLVLIRIGPCILPERGSILDFFLQQLKDAQEAE